MPPIFLIEERLCRDEDGAAALRALGYEVETFEGHGDWRGYLSEFETRVAPEDDDRPADRRRVACLVSRPVARFIESERPFLAAGLFHEAQALCFHRWSDLLPDYMRLNRSFVILPIGTLHKRVDQLRGLFGDRIFLRPDSAEGEFSGLPIALDDLDLELTALTSLNRVSSGMLVIVDAAREIDWHDWRFWLKAGEIVTRAPRVARYGADSPPPRMESFALELAGMLGGALSPAVADIVMDEMGHPRLVDLGAVSTTPFLEGMDVKRLAECFDQLVA